MKKVPVWEKVTREEARADPEGKIVGTRWVIAKNVDRVRCRLVALEFAGKDKREYLYAGTPPLAATRYALSDCVSRGVSRRPTRKLMVLDTKKAFLYGLATRSIYIELPEQEPEGGTLVGKLRRTLYGTRNAPLAWQKVVR